MPNIMLGDKILAVFGDVKDLPFGSQFYSRDCDPLQIGAYRSHCDQEFQPHLHKYRERIQNHITYEFFLIIRGKVDCYIYTRDKIQRAVLPLLAGQWIMCYTGCHGFKVKAEDTVFFEIKNGPFAGVDIDKEKFDWCTNLTG